MVIIVLIKGTKIELQDIEKCLLYLLPTSIESLKCNRYYVRNKANFYDVLRKLTEGQKEFRKQSTIN